MDATTANTIRGRAPLRASQTLRAAIRAREGKAGTISYLYSPKTDRDLVVATDLKFWHVLHLESDSNVKSFDIDVERVVAYLDADGYQGTRPDARVELRSGRVELVEVKYTKNLDDDLRTELQVAAQQRYASQIGAHWRTYTEKDFQAEERLIHDWLHIIVVLGQTRDKVLPSLQADILALVTEKTSQTLHQLCKKQLGPWDLAFSAIFRLIQLGKLTSNLKEKPLAWNTLVRPWK